MLKTKTIVIIAIFINLLSNVSASLKSDTIDVIHYSINLDISNYSSYQISGNTELNIVSKQDGLNYVCLDLLNLTVDSVFINNENTSFSHNDTLLKISLLNITNINDTFSVNVFYQGHPTIDPSGWGGFYFSSGYAFNLGVGFDDNPHNYGRVWYPCIDDFIDRASYDFYIQTSYENMAICGGELISTTLNIDSTKTYHWQLNEEIPTYISSVAVGTYKLVPDTFYGINGAIPINLYVKPTDSTKAVNSFVNLKAILSAYETSFGPYMWNRVGYVSVPFNNGAMEHATNIAFPSASIDGTLNSEWLYAHELAHHWFGDLITCDAAEDMWINEGWASFSEYIYMEFIYGIDEAKKYIRNEHAYNLRLLHHEDDGFRAVYGVPHEYTYSTTVYEKGAGVAHSLRGYLGDSLFFSSVKQLLIEFAYQPISSFQMRDKLSEYSGVDLTAFFDTWVFSPGFPHFSVDSFSVVENSTLYDVTVCMKQKNRGGFHFADNNKVELTFMDKDWNKTSRIVEFSGERGGQTFSLPFNPSSVMVDIDEKLCDATVDNYKILNSIGDYDFDKTYFRAIISDISDSAFIRVEHNWVAPDNLKEQINGLIISDTKYWKIDGILPDTFNATGRFYYNKLANTNGYLDNTLITNSADSLVLFYRPNPVFDWEICSFTKAGNTYYGYLYADTLKLGEYAFGIYHYDRLTANLNSDYDCLQNVSINSNVSGGVPPYSYLWNDEQEQTISSINIESSDFYTVTISDSNNDSIILSKIIDIPDTFKLSTILLGDPESCSGSVELIISGGFEPYNINWAYSEIPQNTIFVDNLCSGFYYFTITDNNACIISDTIIQSIDNIYNQDIKLYPNPNNGAFYIENIDDKEFDVIIYNINGEKVFEKKKFFGNQKVDLKNFSNGVYLIEINTSKNIYHQKMIIQK